MRILERFLSALLMVLLGAVGAQASTGDSKVALVIGNGVYKNAPDLPNPPNDARAMTVMLRSMNFEVIEGINLSKAGMIAKIDEFTEKAYEADIGVIFYAGHGMQVEGKNYLIPVDAELSKAAHLQTRTIEIDELVASLPPDPNIGIVFLDACRDNPLARTLARGLPATRSATIGIGLAPVHVETKGDGTGGTLIAYATDPGAVALDGQNTANSPYTQALIRHLSTPGIELQSALTRVRGEVARQTEGRQRPWHNASLGREVFLGGQPDVTPVAPVPVAETKTDTQTTQVAALNPTDVKTKPVVESTPQVRSKADTWEVERRFWDEVTKFNTVSHYEAYLAEYPEGKFAAIATLNIKQLNATQARLDAAGSTAPTTGQVATVTQTRATHEVTDEIRNTPGTAVSEGSIGMDRKGRRDLQRRLTVLGHDTGGADGIIGPNSRNAIGSWQRENGIVETQMLTPAQYAALKAQSETYMAELRRKEAAAARAAAAKRKKQQAAARAKARAKQKTRTTKRTTTTRRETYRPPAQPTYRRPSYSGGGYSGGGYSGGGYYRQPSPRRYYRGGGGGAAVGGAILGAGAAIVTCKAIGAC